MKKNLKRLIVFLIALIAVVPVMSVSAAETLQNVAVAEDGTITWDAFSEAVNYKINGGAVITTPSADLDDYIGEPINGTVYSIEIKGFNVGGTEVVSYSGEVLYRSGKWFIEFYSITYNTNGGSAIATEYFGSTQDPVLTDIEPTKDGYVFGDWFLNEGLTEYYAINTPLEENITVYASWNKIINSVNITLANPKVGDTVNIIEKHDQYGAWLEPDKFPIVTLENGANYVSNWKIYVKSFPSEGADYDTSFSGTFEKDKYYYAEIFLEAKSGFVFAPNVTIKVNGETTNIEKTEDFDAGFGCLFFVKIKAIDETEEIVANTEQTTNNTSNPNTGDGILFYVGLLVTSILGYATSQIYSKKKLFN